MLALSIQTDSVFLTVICTFLWKNRENCWPGLYTNCDIYISNLEKRRDCDLCDATTATEDSESELPRKRELKKKVYEDFVSGKFLHKSEKSIFSSDECRCLMFCGQKALGEHLFRKQWEVIAAE